MQALSASCLQEVPQRHSFSEIRDSINPPFKNNLKRETRSLPGLEIIRGKHNQKSIFKIVVLLLISWKQCQKSEIEWIKLDKSENGDSLFFQVWTRLHSVVLKFWGLWLSTVKVTGPIPSVSLLLSYFLFVLLPSLQPIPWSKRGDCTLGQGNALSLYVQDAKFLEGAELELQETRSCHRPVKTRPHMVGWHKMQFVIPMPLRGGTNPGRTCSWSWHVTCIGYYGSIIISHNSKAFHQSVDHESNERVH